MIIILSPLFLGNNGLKYETVDKSCIFKCPYVQYK
jgi:hypothetical protein